MAAQSINVIIVGRVNGGLGLDDEQIFINDSSGAENYYRKLLEDMGYESAPEDYDDTYGAEEEISNFLSDQEDENIFWLEYGAYQDNTGKWKVATSI